MDDLHTIEGCAIPTHRRAAVLRARQDEPHSLGPARLLLRVLLLGGLLFAALLALQLLYTPPAPRVLMPEDTAAHLRPPLARACLEPLHDLACVEVSSGEGRAQYRRLSHCAAQPRTCKEV